MALSGMTTDILLPAFTRMVGELSTSLDMVQGTIAAFSLTFGISQFFYGPASDRFGRRPVLLVGLCVYVAGAAVAAFSANIETVLVGRALQGAGAGAAPVIARAILRDTHTGTQLARAMALTWAIFAIGPIFAPLVGYAIIAGYGWRSTFFCLGLVALCLWLFTLLRFRETNLTPNPKALAPASLLRALVTVLSHRQSVYFLTGGCIAYCALFTYITNAPRIFDREFATSGMGFAVLFAITGIGIVLGQIANRRLLEKLGILPTLRIAGTILFASSAGVALLAHADVLGPWQFTALMFGFNTSFLVVVSNTASLCIDPHPTLAGMVSAVYGSFTNIIASIFITITVTFVGISVLHWSIAMCLLTGTCALMMVLASPKWLRLTIN